jgi:hypothetical protein
MARSTAWKKFELWIAKVFCTERNPLSGGNGKHSRSDSLHKKLFISCKHTRAGHAPLFRLVEEETEKAIVEDKIPVIVVGRSGAGVGSKLDNTLIVLPVRYLKAFKDGDFEIDMAPS